MSRAPFDDPETMVYEPFVANGTVGENQWQQWQKNNSERILGLFIGSSEFGLHPENPHPGNSISKIDKKGWANHVALHELGHGIYEIFFYIKMLDRSKFRGIYRMVLDARDGDWNNWGFLLDGNGRVIFNTILPFGSEYLSGGLACDPYTIEDGGRKLMFFLYGPNSEGKISCVELEARDIVDPESIDPGRWLP